MDVVFDIEANGFLDDATKIHCISIGIDSMDPSVCHGKDIGWALDMMYEADTLIGHNIIGYDLPLLGKLLSYRTRPDQQIRDTFVLSRMLWPDIYQSDSDRKKIPRKLWGSHSLEAFGCRMGIEKGELDSFQELTDEMLEYCKQDARVTRALWELCKKKKPSRLSVEIETEFAQLAHEMQTRGIGFNEDEAYELEHKLIEERGDLLEDLVDLVPPVVEELRTPQYWVDPVTEVQYARKADAPSSVRKELVSGPMRVRETRFNPMSRPQVASFLMDRGWEPSDTTPTGKPKVDETILMTIEDIPEASKIARLYRLQKLLGMLSEGRESWLKLSKGGRLHPRLLTLGTVSGRTSCVRPNLQQVPSPRLPYGKECRQLFYAGDGMKLVGVDAKSLEVRCFAHYLSKYDKGEFASQVLSGDIHQANADLMKCDRQTAKNTFFALLYGASHKKIAAMLNISVQDAGMLVGGLFDRRPAMRKLISAVRERAVSRGYLLGLDGRKLMPRSEHSSVNLLIQAAGACVSKQAALNVNLTLGTLHDWTDAHIVGFIHDEIIIEAPEHLAEPILEMAIQEFKYTTQQLSLCCPMDGDGRVGNTWYDIH